MLGDFRFYFWALFHSNRPFSAAIRSYYSILKPRLCQSTLFMIRLLIIYIISSPYGTMDPKLLGTVAASQPAGRRICKVIACMLTLRVTL